MKRLLSASLLFVVFLAIGASLRAQTTVMRPAVAFVKPDRSILYIKQIKQPDSPDTALQSYDLAALVTQATSGFVTINSIQQLAVIGYSASEQRLVLGATVNYYNTSSSANVTYQGLLTVPWPLSTFSLTNSINLMLPARNTSSFKPAGILSKDGKQWWATMSSASQGYDSLIFYHGNVDGTGKIDSTVYANSRMEEGFHMSNLALDISSNPNTLLAMSFDRLLDADPATFGRTILYAWRAGQGDVSGTDFSAVYKNLAANYFTGSPKANTPIPAYIDSMFGLTVIPVNDAANVYIGLNSNLKNSIDLYKVPYYAADFALTSPQYNILRSVIPSTENFYAGKGGGTSPCGTYDETYASPTESQQGNCGDVFVNSIGGDSVLFITHNSDDNCAHREEYSSIYYYDYTSGNQSATLVYNDPTSPQPLQPVWIMAPYTIPKAVQYGGIAWKSVSTTNFGTVDTGKNASLSFTVSDTSQSTAVVVDSATITGANASEFAITSGSASTTLQPGGQEQISVKFTPVPPAGAVSATLTVYFEGQTSNMSIAQSLSGTVNVPTNTGGVKEDAALAATMSIEPNPFSSSTAIQLTAPDAGALGIVVHDALGRTVYTSDLRETGAGQTQAFAFDAKSLGLPDGVYFVTAFLGERQASRQVMFVR